jgi:cytosine/adenosine deaminase-related metal-dependent hydrolase
MRDFFNPLGSGDVKQVALLLSYLQRFFLQEEVEQVFDMITDGGAKVLSIKDYGIKDWLCGGYYSARCLVGQ